MAPTTDTGARIAAALAPAAPPGWTRISLTVRATVLAYDYATEVAVGGRAGTLDLPQEVKRGFQELRREMYVPERGTWFSARLVLAPGAPPELSVNYDEDPRWWPSLHPTAFTRDLEAFPRSADNTPPWLAAVVAEGRRLEQQQPGAGGPVP